MGRGAGVGEGSGDGVGAGLMRCVLIVVNIFFGLLGFIFLAAGAFIRLGQEYYMPFVDGAVESLPSLMAGAGLSDGSSQPDDVQVDFNAILSPISIGLIIMGVFLFTMGILGCISACCQVKVIMIVYVIVLIVLFICQVALTILYATQGVGGVMKSTLEDMIVNDFGGIDDYAPESLVLNVLMVQFKCCGANNHKDFDDATKWNNNRTFTYEEAGVSYSRTETMATPIACCKFTGTLPSVSIDDEKCAIVPYANEFNNNMNTGCVEAIEGELDSFQTIILGVLGGIIAFEFLLIVFVIALIVLKSKEDGKVTV